MFSSFRDEEIGAARTSAGDGAQFSASPTPRLVQPPAPESPLSEGVARFLLRQEQEGAATLTLANFRGTAWSLLEFLQCDPPLREMSGETAVRWIDWLRTTPVYRRKRGAYPRQFTRQSVSAFFAWTPPKRTKQAMRKAGTVAKYRREGCRMLRWLGVKVEIERRKKKVFRRLPPIVPKVDTIAERWRAVLASPAVSRSHARQVVLTQALILLWGVRLKEGLTTCLDNVEEHWVLCTGKTGMRLGYFNAQALGIVRALRGQTVWEWAAARHGRVSNWPWGCNKWHHFVRQVGIDNGDKPQQDLRKRFATIVKAKDPEVEMLLAGHGGGVIFDHYLDTLERVPGVMEDFPALPDLGLDDWTWPEPVYLHRPENLGADGPWGATEEAKAAAARTPPRRLYARFDQWLEEQERRAAS